MNERIVAEINLDNIAFNMEQIKKSAKGSKTLAVVKADAYGHGAVEVSKKVIEKGADYLAVALCSEGVELRQKNINLPILILGATFEEDIEDVIKYDLMPTIFTLETAVAYSQKAAELNKAVNIHIKIDTGMSRIGFMPDDNSLEIIKKINSLPNINIVGVFTHMAKADSVDKSYAYEQFEKFKYITDKIKEFKPDIICHCANSASIMEIEEFNLDMVRGGIMLYGLYPSDETDRSYELRPAMSLITQISYVKKVKKGTSIGYSRTYIAPRDMVVATIPVGYADGYSRRMSNMGRVIINNEYAPIVGNVCMDQFMVDVTDINATIGDKVILIGKEGDKEISCDEIAQIVDTINYEIVCDVSKRVPRKYV